MFLLAASATAQVPEPAPAQSPEPPAVPAASGQEPGQSPDERYATFVQMAGQIEDQVARGMERLPGGPVAGLVGEDGFITTHAEMLRASAAAIEAGETFPEARQEAHARAVLAFLNRATQLTRLINDLENAETNGDAENAARLRAELGELAGERLFQELVADAPARLVVTVGAGDADAVYWPHAIHRVDVAVENRGDATASGVSARIEPESSIIADVTTGQGSCTAEIGDETTPGAPWTCAVDSLGSGEGWSLGVAFRHAAPDGIGAGDLGEARISIAASARAPALGGATAETGIEVANCSANYHRQLDAMRPAEAQHLLDTLHEVRKPVPGLPRRWLTRKVRWEQTEVGELVRRAERIAAAGGAERWLADQAREGAVARVVYGLRGYIRQGMFPALCTGADQVVASYRGFLDEFDRHRQDVGADAETARSLARAALDRFAEAHGVAAEVEPSEEESDGAAAVAAPATFDDLVSRFADTAQIALDATPSGETPPMEARLAALRTLADSRLGGLVADEDALAIAREALSLIEVAFNFEVAGERYALLARAFDDVLAGIANASAAECRCRSGSEALAPATAAVPVDGIAAPARILPPRPKPAGEGAAN